MPPPELAARKPLSPPGVDQDLVTAGRLPTG